MAVWLSLVVALVPFAVWGLRVYLARMNQSAVEAERQAGRDAQQSEAQNAENKRVVDAATAGAAAGRLPIDTPDPFDEARK